MAHYETVQDIARDNPDEVMVGFGTPYILSPVPVGAPIASAAADVASK